MTGVEILSSETICNTFIPDWWIGVGFLAIMVGGLVCAILCCYTKYSAIGVVCLMLTGFLWTGLTYFSLTPNTNNPSHIEYKVTIDDSVSMNEFLDKYEILDQEGKIYTVKEKE